MVTLAKYKREMAQKAIDAKEVGVPWSRSAKDLDVPIRTLMGWVSKTVYLNEEEKTKEESK